MGCLSLLLLPKGFRFHGHWFRNMPGSEPITYLSTRIEVAEDPPGRYVLQPGRQIKHELDSYVGFA
eukprot:6476814-Amphidinium_carterae.1